MLKHKKTGDGYTPFIVPNVGNEHEQEKTPTMTPEVLRENVKTFTSQFWLNTG